MALSARTAAPVRAAAARPAAARPLAVRRRGAVAVRASAEVETAMAFVEPKDVKPLVDDKGYVVIDVRTLEENAEASKWWWKNVPLFVTLRSGDMARNKQFNAMFEKAFPNKMSRAIFVCDETHERCEMVWDELIAPGGYTAMKVLKGGAEGYFEFSPLDEKDRKPRWRLTGQTSGVRYAYNDGEGDDSA